MPSLLTVISNYLWKEADMKILEEIKLLVLVNAA
jgi:hypothetical protein